MSLIVFVGLAWFLTAPVVGVLLGRMIRTADRDQHEESLFTFLEQDLRGAAPARRRR